MAKRVDKIPEFQGFLMFGVKLKVPCTTYDDTKSPSLPKEFKIGSRKSGCSAISALLTV